MAGLACKQMRGVTRRLFFMSGITSGILCKDLAILKLSHENIIWNILLAAAMKRAMQSWALKEKILYFNPLYFWNKACLTYCR